MSTDLRQTFQDAIDRFNNPSTPPHAYDALGELFHAEIGMKSVDPPPRNHKNKPIVLDYLKTKQEPLRPQFSAPQSGWNVTGETGTIGKITGNGKYQDSSVGGTPLKDVKYEFVFERAATADSWLLKSGVASIL
jgi:hypothetical protein